MTFTAVAFSGSLRADSANTGLVRLAAGVAPEGLRVEVTDLPASLPFYNPDLENDLPEVAARWRELVIAADAVVVGVPEYNFGPSAMAKNAIDWLSRPLGEHALQRKVVALLTAGGKGGGVKVQESLGTILGLLGNTVVAEPAVTIPLGATRIGAAGTDDVEIRELVTAKMAAVHEALAAR